MGLAKQTYRETSRFPKEETFGLQSQIRRAAVSVPSNIAEGRGRLTDKSFRAFLGQARGSLYELETQIELSSELGMMDSQRSQQLVAECQEIGRMLNALIRTLRNNEEQTLADAKR